MKYLKLVLTLTFSLFVWLFASPSQLTLANTPNAAPSASGGVVILEMDMMILPGTAVFLARSIKEAEATGAELVIVKLNTPGGVLQSSQEMVQTLFQAQVPVAVYVSPAGATAASAGVFITMAGHIAAMAPGTTIGAAHPVQGDGKDIEGDMREKAESITAAMVRAIAENRGRNIEWAEKSVRESSSLTEKEALKQQVVDFVAEDIDELLNKLEGKVIKLPNGERKLTGLAPRVKLYPQLSTRERAINALANPTIAALLWLGATTGLTIELYNPGAILPGMVGLICLILALIVNQIIPLNQGGIVLMVVGSLLVAAEVFIPTGLLAIGGLIAIILGAMYLVDPGEMPGLMVNMNILIPVAVLLGGVVLWIAYSVIRSRSRVSVTGQTGMVGMVGRALENFTTTGQITVGGEIWRANAVDGIIEKDQQVRVVAVLDGLILQVEPVAPDAQ